MSADDSGILSALDARATPIEGAPRQRWTQDPDSNRTQQTPRFEVEDDTREAASGVEPPEFERDVLGGLDARSKMPWAQEVTVVETAVAERFPIRTMLLFALFVFSIGTATGVFVGLWFFMRK